MSRRIPVALAATAALGVSALVIGPALASPAHSAAAKKNRITIRGGQTFKPGHYVKDNMRFTPLHSKVRSGATVTVVNKTSPDEPHTISFIKKSQVPRNDKQIVGCMNFKGVCGQLVQAHQADPQTGEVKQPIVDPGTPGVDGPGNSYYIAPGTKKIKFKVSAKKGTTLYYFCVIHPWMQGKIKVR